MAVASGLPPVAAPRKSVTERRASSRLVRAVANAFSSRSFMRAGSLPTLCSAVSICNVSAASP